MRYQLVVCGLAAFGAPSITAAQADKSAAPPTVLTRVIDCRAIAEGAQRLVCFDNASAALAEAQRNTDMVIVSRNDVREARRGLFGLTLPKIRLFGGNDEEEEEAEEVKEIVSTIASISTGSRGYVFTLPDGAVWEMTENDYLNPPQVGQAIHIKRAAFGSYMAKVEKGRSVRVRRRV